LARRGLFCRPVTQVLHANAAQQSASGASDPITLRPSTRKKDGAARGIADFLRPPATARQCPQVRPGQLGSRDASASRPSRTHWLSCW
jgi:hypothetical protein